MNFWSINLWFWKWVSSTLINFLVNFTSITLISLSNLHQCIDFTCQFSWKFFKHALTWFVTNNGTQGMLKYNAFNMRLHIIQWFPRFSLGMREKGVPEIQAVHDFFHEWFGLGFSGVGLPSLAHHVCVPADSATLDISALKICICALFIKLLNLSKFH